MIEPPIGDLKHADNQVASNPPDDILKFNHKTDDDEATSRGQEYEDNEEFKEDNAKESQEDVQKEDVEGCEKIDNVKRKDYQEYIEQNNNSQEDISQSNILVPTGEVLKMFSFLKQVKICDDIVGKAALQCRVCTEEITHEVI